jgi:8-amino-7-oxononanoate synthase
VVDEAHAVGVYGNNGEGLVQALGLEDEVAIRLVTFGKALGCHGAAVLASGLIKEYLVNFSRSFIYSTALPPMAVRVIKDAYSFMRTNEQNKLLQKNIMYFKVAADANNLKGLISSDSAVQCIVIPGNKESKKSSEYLQEKGFDVRAILSPTVPLGSERLRICIHSFNTETEIDELILNLSTIKNIK